MAKKVKTFRLDDDTINKIDVLVEEQSKSSEGWNRRLSASEIITKAVNELYARNFDKENDNAYLEMFMTSFESMLDLKLKSLTDNIEGMIDEEKNQIALVAEKNYLAIRLILQMSRNSLPNYETVRALLNSESYIDNALFDKLSEHEN